MQANLLFAWCWILVGLLSGAVTGLFFHRDHWLGGYDSWPRRMTRLAHIAFLGTGLINLLAAPVNNPPKPFVDADSATGSRINGSERHRVSRVLWWIGQVTLLVILAVSVGAWMEQAIRSRSNSLLVHTTGGNCVQVFLREKAISVTLFQSRYMAAEPWKCWFESHLMASDSAAIHLQREPHRSGWTGSWGVTWGRLALAGQWGDPVGRHNLIGMRTPLWLIILLTMLAWLGLMRSVYIRHRRIRNGLCLKCGYDLRASKDTCPECGWNPRPRA